MREAAVMRRGLAALVLVVAAAGRPAAAGFEYAWALPEWRATWAAPRPADNRGFAVAASDDAVYVAGVTGSHGVGAGDLFVLRYGLDGRLVWARIWGGIELDQAQDLALGADGIWVAGSATTDDGEVRAALLRLSYDGEVVLERTWAAGEATVLQGIALGEGAIYVVGLTQTEGNRDAYAARLDATGEIEWERTLGGDGWDELWDVGYSEEGVLAVGYATGTSTDALLVQLNPDNASLGYERRWGGPGNDEARALAIVGDTVYVTGGMQEGRSTDVFVAVFDVAELIALRTTGGKVVGGGGYGIAVTDRWVYVAAGTYDFPAGGDGALLRFRRFGELELDWQQVYGLPGFWDWSFDVTARDGRFYAAGVLWQPGAEWYRVMTVAYREDFPTATLTGVASKAASGDTAGATAAMEHFWVGDFLRWAEERDPTAFGSAEVIWEGASNSGRTHGSVSVRGGDEPPIVELDNADGAMLGVGDDLRNGNYAFVRDYTGVRGSLFDGWIRFRYYISHDRLIPQGGYILIGELGIPLPPPPV